MPVNDELGKRMKENYENRAKTALIRRMPVAIRIDGKAFHTFTRGFDKPFDTLFIHAMNMTTKYLCENIQGCVFGYTQSDEITLILQDYEKLTTDAWFDYEVQKMCSVAASMATMRFNQVFQEQFFQLKADTLEDKMCGREPLIKDSVMAAYQRGVTKGAMFDARCFNIPKEEVCNLIYWRQVDAVRNSIQGVGQANFSQKELQNKTCNQIQDMLHEQKGINWNNYPAAYKRGRACIKVTTLTPAADGQPPAFRSVWQIDNDMPTLVGEDRKYVENRILFD